MRRGLRAGSIAQASKLTALCIVVFAVRDAPASFLLLRDERIDALLQHRQRHRTFGEHRVVESAQVELRSELLLGASRAVRRIFISPSL